MRFQNFSQCSENTWSDVAHYLHLVITSRNAIEIRTKKVCLNFSATPHYHAWFCLPVPGFFKLPQRWLAGPKCILLFSPSVLLGQPRTHISRHSPVLCVATGCPGGIGHCLHCFHCRRGEGNLLPGRNPSFPLAGPCEKKYVIIGLVNFKFTFCAASTWEGNYGCPFLACKSC